MFGILLMLFIFAAIITWGDLRLFKGIDSEYFQISIKAVATIHLISSFE